MSHLHLSFLDWVVQEAALIGSDGCSFATGMRRICCQIHDLEYFYGKSAASAYRRYREGWEDYWGNAEPTTRAICNRDFIDCNRRESWLGFWSPIAFIRQLVKPLGRRAWDRHRKREADALSARGT